MKIPEIHPISDLARDARALVAQARDQGEPIVITQRGREVAVLLPIEVYRDMERRLTARIFSPLLLNPADAAAFRMKMEIVDEGESLNAGL